LTLASRALTVRNVALIGPENLPTENRPLERLAHVTKRPLDPVLCLNVALVLALSEIVLLTATKIVTFSWYGYFADFRVLPLWQGIDLALVAVALVILSLHLVDRYPLAMLAVWLLAGSAGQIMLHNIYGYTLSDVVNSQYGNTFYAASLNLHARDLLAGFSSIAGSLPTHVKANMPGKVLLYQGLELLTADPYRLALLIIAISNLGGVLLYFIVSAIYESRAVALSSFILYLFIPARIYFMPLLNTVSVLPILACLLLFLHSLNPRRRLLALLMGACLYAALFFDPLPIFLAPFFVALAAQAWMSGKASIGNLFWIGALAVAGFLAVYMTMYFACRFDMVPRLITVWVENREFNRQQGRPYFPWVWLNLVGFSLSAGALVCLLCLLYAALGTIRFVGALRSRRLARQAMRSLFEPGPLMLATMLVTLAGIDLAGGNRGEAERLWIFLMVFLQVVAAGFCCQKAGKWTVGIVLAGSIIQTAVTISTVAFIV